MSTSNDAPWQVTSPSGRIVSVSVAFTIEGRSILRMGRHHFPTTQVSHRQEMTMDAREPRFVGRITDSETAKNAALQVAVEISGDKLEIVLSDDEQWVWEMKDVSMSRVAIDRFEFALGDENLYFLPVDPMAFVRDVMVASSDTPVEPYRGFLRRRIDEAQAMDDGAAPELAAA